MLEAESGPVGLRVVWPLGSWWAWVILPLTLGGGVGLHSARSTGDLAPQETLGMEQKNGYDFKVNVRTASRPRRDRKGQNDQRTYFNDHTSLGGYIEHCHRTPTY